MISDYSQEGDDDDDENEERKRMFLGGFGRVSIFWLLFFLLPVFAGCTSLYRC